MSRKKMLCSLSLTKKGTCTRKRNRFFDNFDGCSYYDPVAAIINNGFIYKHVKDIPITEI
jgi:hypothetical protein